MNLKRILALLLFNSTVICSISAQKITPLKVGDRCPNLILRNLINHTAVAKFSDFRGKLLVLDFGGISCGPCVASARRLDSLWNNGYKAKIAPIWCMSKLSWSIANADPKKRKSITIKYLPKTASGKPISIPVDWGDTYLYEYFPHLYYPYVVWIDQKGVIIAITDHDYVSEHFIKEALLGKTADWPIKNDMFDQSKKLMDFDSVNINTLRKIPQPITYHSVFSHLDGLDPQLVFPLNLGVNGSTEKSPSEASNKKSNSKRVFLANLSLLKMYIYDFKFDDPIQQPNRSLAIELSSSKRQTLFADASNLYDSPVYSDVEWKKTNTFCYDGVFPVSMSDEEIRKSVALHLDETFGIHGSLEKRLVDCWVVTSDRVKTKAFNSTELPDDSLYREGDKIKRLKGYINLFYVAWNGNRIDGGPPIIDESKTSDNQKVYITKADLMDFDKLNAALNPYGLVVKKEKRELEMLVITENGYQPKQQP